MTRGIQLSQNKWTFLRGGDECSHAGCDSNETIQSSNQFPASNQTTGQRDGPSVRIDKELNQAGSVAADKEKEKQVMFQDAIVYLTGKHIYRQGRTHCPSLLHSLGSLARHFPVSNPGSVPVVMILSDVDLDNKTLAKIEQASPFPVQFHVDVPFSKTKDEPEIIPGYKWDASYKRMCAFWFKYFFELDFLPNFVMRMDTDSCLTSDMPKNPFETMRERKLDYMWYSTFYETADVIVDLKNFTESHPGNPVTDHDNDPSYLWEDEPNAPMRVFSTNLEWLYIPAFRRPEVLEWKQEVMESQGIFEHRWGDAPLRTLVATKFFNTSAVARFCNFDYAHSMWKPFLACDPSHDIHASPGRKIKKTLENGTTVETTFGWENIKRRRL